MADGHAGLAISDAITDFLLPALGMRMFMRHKDGATDPTSSSQDEHLLLGAVESLKKEKPDLRGFIIGYFRYLKKTHRTRMLPRLRETISRAAGKDGQKNEEVQKLLVAIFESELEKVTEALGPRTSDYTDPGLDETYERLSSELDLILTQRLGANLSDRYHQVRGYLAGLDDEACDAADDFKKFMEERKARRGN